jgi:hypothetical protein
MDNFVALRDASGVAREAAADPRQTGEFDPAPDRLPK